MLEEKKPEPTPPPADDPVPHYRVYHLRTVIQTVFSVCNDADGTSEEFVVPPRELKKIDPQSLLDYGIKMDGKKKELEVNGASGKAPPSNLT